MNIFLTLISIIFLSLSVATQLLVYTTKSLYENQFTRSDQQAIFSRCVYGRCMWLSLKQFNRDPRKFLFFIFCNINFKII